MELRNMSITTTKPFFEMINGVLGRILPFGYWLGALPFIIGIIGSMYFRPCTWGMC